MATAKAMITILTRDPKRDISQDHVKRLVKLMANDREELCEQAVNALTGLGPDAEDPLWASLGTGTYPTNISDTIARAILMSRRIRAEKKVKKEGEDVSLPVEEKSIKGGDGDPLLGIAFTKLADSDPQSRHAAVAFLKTSVRWHLLMSSAYECKVEKLLAAFKAISSRELLVDIVSLIVDLTPDYQALFNHFEIRGLAPSIFKPWKEDPVKQPAKTSGAISEYCNGSDSCHLHDRATSN